jgi:alkanesulfonate monooxygenase SsuD/methylene tetrahydromethanopterin reductase-like flavin-dependent oxidoreductase (luciferase family)
MKVSVFHTLRYGRVPNQPNTWPVPNALFDPEQGMRAMSNSLEDAEMEDQLGFDWVACAEHHYSPFSLSSNVAVQAAALSQRVKRARIAILGALVPLGNPVRIAEELAMIDNLTGGRLVAGLIRGAPYEYLVYNVNPSESRSRFDEGWELIMKAWSERQPFGWEGRHFRYRQISIWPRPVQQPMPPVYISGSSRDSGEFAARKRIGLGFAGATNIPSASRSARFYEEKAVEYGWEPTPEHKIYQIGVHVAETDQKAWDRIRGPIEGGEGAGLARGQMIPNRLAATSGFYGERDSDFVARYQGTTFGAEGGYTLEGRLDIGSILAGSPDTVFGQIKRVRDEVGAGIINLIFDAPGVDRPAKLESLQLFAKEVLPRVHEL